MKLKPTKIFFKVLLATLITVVAVYCIADKYLILDKKQVTYGIYDFFPAQIDAEVEAIGTGKQFINDRMVETEITIQKIISSNNEIVLKPGDTIRVHEYFDIINNRNIYPIPFMPGKSIVGMGTNYKRLKQNEIGQIKLQFQ
ncbi:hypothetical protein [Paenibacillus roseipurpureus]|uniref:Uncharacterized protein n=1 Tax=Paenibacillus roseopurpureus TaxID=2918901 RepID=A0AA96LS15_9BACL|nr:hypothetical protein [Paenibacillus sp. MBLB1832]WNR43675.1 hypothetical protein MJB10_21620 [Paenibacillus sp. MBLB1832]